MTGRTVLGIVLSLLDLLWMVADRTSIVPPRTPRRSVRRVPGVPELATTRQQPTRAVGERREPRAEGATPRCCVHTS